MADHEIDRMSLISSILVANSELIKFADRKAQLLLRLALTLFMVSFLGVPPAVIALNEFTKEGGWKLVLFGVVLALYVTFAACLLVAIAKIIAVMRPRIVQLDAAPTRLFFGSIARMEPTDFRRLVRDISYEDALEDVIGQAYQSAVIANAKYGSLDEAINWMLGGGICGVPFALILLVSSGLIS